MGALRCRLVLVGLCGLVSACSVSSAPPRQPVGTSSQALGLEATRLQLTPSTASLPVTQTPGGTVYWDGADYRALVPTFGAGRLWFRVPLDGTRPQLQVADDGGPSQGLWFSESRAIDGGVLVVSGPVALRLDDRGHQVAQRPISGNEDRVRLLSQHFLGIEWRDGGASLEEIDLSDGGMSVARTTPLQAPSRVGEITLSGSAVAVLSGGPVQFTIHTFDRSSGASLGSVAAPTFVAGFTMAPTPAGFLVIWISNGDIVSRPLSRMATWLGPEALFAAGPVVSVNRPHQLADGGVLLSWRSHDDTFLAGPGGAATDIPERSLSSLSCEGPVCVAFVDGTAYFFEPGAPSARSQQLIHVVPWQVPTVFTWNRRIWVVLDEGATSSQLRQRRLTVFNPDAGRLDDVALLPVLEQEFVIAGQNEGPAMTTNGTVFQLLTEVDGGVLLGPFRPLLTAASSPVAPRLFSHEGKFLVMWGASGNGFTVLDSAGTVVVPAQSVPQPGVRPQQIGVGTPPGEFWLTYGLYPWSPLEVVRVSLNDGGLTFGTPPGLVMATSPESMLMETPLGFVVRTHDGGVSAPFGPLRNGPTVWTGEEFHVYSGPSRIVGSTVVDTGLLVPAIERRVASDGQGTTLATVLESEWDWRQGQQMSRVRGLMVRSAALPLGRACVLGSDCQSAHCVDSVCCNTACGSGADDCQACSVAQGSTVPDGVCGPVNRTVVCRWDQDFCDAPEYCDGVTAVCPPDRLHDAGFACRPFQGLCDVPERCDGVTSTCPADAVSPRGTPCDDDNECTVNDVCYGMYQGREACEGTARTGACDAGSQCYIGDSCQRGYCIQGAYCPAPECQVSNGCAASGCLFGPAPDGAGCDGGSCLGGVCFPGGLDGGVPDAGADGGASFDAGSTLDAGLSVDGGGTSDGGIAQDGGSSFDAGSAVDAGVSVDAGFDGGGPFDAGPSDAGVSVDAGAPVDAGRVDSGSPDASTPDVPDSGSVDGSDGGRLAAVGAEAGPLASGLGCASSGGSSLAAVLAVLLLRRRFRQPKRPAR